MNKQNNKQQTTTTNDNYAPNKSRLARQPPSPQKLAYALSAVRGARRELAAFADAFNVDGTYDAAREYYYDLIASGR